MYIISLNQSKGYEEISKNGCIHSNGLQLRSCYRIIDLPNECESNCTFESKWCVGYQIRKVEDEYNYECELFPSNDTFTLCPEGWKDNRHNDNLEIAQTVFDLIGDKDGDYGYACFGNMTSKNLLHFCNSKKPILL